MYYVDFTADNKDYRLRLNTRNVIALEKALGCNPIAIFGDGDTIPTTTVLINVLHASLQHFHHGITLNDAMDIFDKWLEDGHNSVEFVKVILEIYKASGIVPSEIDSTEEAVEHEKN